MELFETLSFLDRFALVRVAFVRGVSSNSFLLHCVYLSAYHSFIEHKSGFIEIRDKILFFKSYPLVNEGAIVIHSNKYQYQFPIPISIPPKIFNFTNIIIYIFFVASDHDDLGKLGECNHGVAKFAK